MGTDVDRHVPGAQECAELIGHTLDLWSRDSVGAGMQPPRDLQLPVGWEVVCFDHEAEALRFRLEAEQVDEFLGLQARCSGLGRPT